MNHTNSLYINTSALTGGSVYGALGWTGYGVYGKNSTGYAGYFSGKARVTGYLTKSGGGFQIDHPLDPANKYLNHSFVDSPDMMNVYNGNVICDEDGGAVVSLPDYFAALNRDFRYQLTCIGGFAEVYIAEEFSDNQFTIAGGYPGLKVSWQITGIRQDPFANANRPEVEEDKPDEELGKYIHPALYDMPASAGIDDEHDRLKEVRFDSKRKKVESTEDAER